MSCHCHCHRSALEREFDFVGDMIFWAMCIVTLWYLLKAVFWVLSKGIPWLLVGLWSFLTWVFSGIDRCFSLGLGVVAGWRTAAEGRKVERRRRALEEQRLLQEKVTIAIAAVDGPDAALSLEALERLRDYAKEGSGEAALPSGSIRSKTHFRCLRIFSTVTTFLLSWLSPSGFGAKGHEFKSRPSDHPSRFYQAVKTATDGTPSC